MSVHDLLAINKESACELFGSVSYITQTLILILLIRETLEELSIIQLEKGKTEKQKKENCTLLTTVKLQFSKAGCSIWLILLR